MIKNGQIDKLTLAENNLQRVNYWISNSDAKIGIVLAFQGGLTAFLTTKTSDIKQIITTQSFDISHLILYISILIYGFLLIKSVFSAFKALYPDITTRELSVFYFGSIAQMGATKFKKQFKSLSEEEIINELSDQVCINSKIALDKFTYVKSSIKSLILSGIFWVIILILMSVLI